VAFLFFGGGKKEEGNRSASQGRGVDGPQSVLKGVATELLCISHSTKVLLSSGERRGFCAGRQRSIIQQKKKKRICKRYHKSFIEGGGKGQ